MITLNRKVRFSHPDFSYSGTNYTEYLLGSVGLKVNADIWVDIHWEVEDASMLFTAADNSIERLDNGSFIEDGFRDGDAINISGTLLNNLVVIAGSIIVTDSIIYLTGGVVNESASSATIRGTTPITAMDFYPNLIENNSDLDLFNLTDRETVPKYYADTITSSPTPMIVGTNSHGWVSPADAATIYQHASSTPFNQIFVISHNFTILPLFLADQLQNVQKGIPPAAGNFKDRFCLKYVFTIDGKFTPLDPDIVHTTDGNVEFPKGQTGWYNEFVNGRPTVYTKESISYSEALTGDALTGIEYCKETDVVARFNSQGNFGMGGSFCSGNGQPCGGFFPPCNDFDGGVCVTTAASKMVLHVLWLPLDEAVYVNTTTDYKTNFIYERAVVTIGSTAQGENAGDYHFLKDVVLSVSNVNQAQLNFTIDFSAYLEEKFDCIDQTNRNYLIFVTVQDPDAVNITDIDQTALILDTNIYGCDKDDPTLFQIIDEVQFFEYPHCDGCGYSSFSLLPMDTVLVKAQFHVKQGTELNPIILNNIGVGLIAVRQNGIEEFPLEAFEINTSRFLPNCENIQEIVFSQERDFILPSTDCRNEIKLFRMPTLDIAGYSAYELIYPFKVRWEEWRALQPANRCFPTPTQNWMIYDNEAGWSIKFSIKAEVEKQYPATDCLAINPVITDFEHITWGEIKDPCEIPYSVEFNTFDVTGANTYEEVVAKDTDTFVEATITGDFSGYTEDQLYGILTLDAWGVGGVAYSQEIGTRIAVDPNGVWYGTGTTLKATLTKVSDTTVKLSAYIDYRYIPTDTNQLILSARIGEFRECGSSSGDICLDEIIVDTFTCGELQIIQVIDANTLVVSGEVVTQEMRSVFVDEMIIVFITPTTWTIVGGFINGNEIFDGIVGGNIIVAPTHPYTDNNVGDTIQGDVTGVIYSGESCEDLRQFDDLENHLWDDGEQAAFE